jgi:hypothetical protein
LKRAVHILFWSSLVAALLVFLLRQGKVTPKVAQPPSADSAVGPAPIPAPPPVVVAPEAGSALPAKSRTISETALMQQIRDQVKTNPTLAVELAREGRLRFGDSSDSDERDKLLVDGLVNQQKIGDARVETSYYYRHHPNGRYAGYLFTMTGARPDPPAGPPTSPDKP